VSNVLKNRGIAFKLILLCTVSSALILLVIFSYDYSVSRSMLEKNIRNQARALVLATVDRIENILLPVEKVPQNLSSFLEKRPRDRRELLELLRTVVERNPEIYGAAVAFEPYRFAKEISYFAPYCYKEKNGNVKFVDLGNKSYKYIQQDWYQIPKELNRPEWTEPYFHEGGGEILMATYSVPLYRRVGGKKEFIGIVTADISLGWLQDAVSSIKVLQTGYGFLISKNGTVVTHPLKDLIMNETIFGVAEARDDKGLREIGRKMIRGESGFTPFRSIGSEKMCWMCYTSIPSNGWSLAVLFPQNELTGDIDRLSRIVIVLGVIGLLLLSLAVTLIARSIARPLKAMARATEEIATGNLDIDLPALRSKDEVARLTDSFNHMKTSLKQYIKELTETTAAKERIESELKIAHDIQMGLLPKLFPEKKEFDIYATLEPAREVGGDLYDFSLLGDDHLFFLVGDVSGKGVPAALFMAVAKTLLNRLAEKCTDPSLVLTQVNKELYRENESSMFVTLFCGVLNLKTGDLLFSNAGHNPPLMIRSGQRPEWLKVPEGFVLGVVEDAAYRTERILLSPGDRILLYTDGVTEAMSREKAFYSEKRLMSAVEKGKSAPVEALIQEVLRSVKEFTEGEALSDDITLLALQFKGQ
jgi:sigma-B regulation protein RsbU (phosphoserine phosphatase)